MGKLRSQYASVFEKVCRLHSDALWQLDAAAEGLRHLTEQQRRADEEREQALLALEQRFALERARLEREHGFANSRRESSERESSLAASQTGDAMRTLNSLFRDMQQESEGGTSKADLRARVSLCDEAVAEATLELAQLRPVKAVAARVPTRAASRLP